jgi:formylglycine-generating enzyme required for sulfatase activity
MPKERPTRLVAQPATDSGELDLYRFIEIGPDACVPHPFWIAKYPVTNGQYERFLEAPDFAAEGYWRGFLKFDENCQQMGQWGDEGWIWLQETQKNSQLSPDGKRVLPKYWGDIKFGIAMRKNPVVGVTWFEASAYCQWLRTHWAELAESRANPGLRPRLVRLPLKTEWVIAAGGDDPQKRFPWDAPNKMTEEIKEIVHRANVHESGIGHTMPVDTYPEGASPHGVMDMAGNAWEWQANYDKDNDLLALRGGSWHSNEGSARLSARPFLAHDSSAPYGAGSDLGFRVVALPE